jgi:hypothetical protein
MRNIQAANTLIRCNFPQNHTDIHTHAPHVSAITSKSIDTSGK